MPPVHRQTTIRKLLCLTLTWLALVVSGCDSSPPGAAIENNLAKQALSQTPVARSSTINSATSTPFPLSHNQQQLDLTGPQACSGCHADQVNEWSASHHAHANRPISVELDRTAFTPKRSLQESGVTYEMEEQDGAFLIRTVKEDGSSQEFPLVGVIGHTPVRQYLALLPGNKLQTISATYDVAQDRWIDVFAGENRQPGEWGHWTGQGMNWNANCAWCHTTEYRKNFDFDNNAYNSSWVQQGISCASCHNGLESHVESARAGANMELPTTLSAQQTLETCVGCHSRRDQMTADGFKPGDRYNDHFNLSLPDQPGLYYPDGQIRDEVFVYGSFAMSKMHGAGVTCVNCHNPHSLKTILPVDDNSLCQSCHQAGAMDAPLIDPVAHSFHPEGSAGNQCVNCHMPKTTYMQADPRADHGFLLPDPLMMEKLGIPNACSNCHSDQSLDWAVQWGERRHGAKLANSSQRQRALAIDAAYKNQPEGLPLLLALLEGETIPAWRATYIGLLTIYPPNDNALAAIRSGLGDDSPLVRSRSAAALAMEENPQVAMDMLGDDSLTVRIAASLGLAARGIAVPSAGNSPANAELQHYLAFHRDRPQSLFVLATQVAQQGKHSEVLRHIRRAINLDSRNPDIYHQSAILLSAAGLASEAKKTLLDGWQLFPDSAVLPYSLGLLAGEAGDMEAAIRYLQKTVALDPAFQRAWYNLSLAYSRTGRAREAQEAMARANSGP